MMILLPDRLLINTDNIVSGQPNMEGQYSEKLPYVLQATNQGQIFLTPEQERVFFSFLNYAMASKGENA